MATTSESEKQENTTTQAAKEQECPSQVGWEALFSFTTVSHVAILVSAFISAILAAATLPVFSIIYGLVFGAYSDYGSGKVDGDQLLSEVTRLCLIMTGIAASSWILNSIFFFLFLLFGELQARSARARIFDLLIRKDIAWFDMRESGIAASLPAIQMHIRDLQLSVSAPLGEALQCVVATIGAMGVAFYYSWNLTLVTTCTVPLIYLVEAYLSKELSARALEQANQLQQALKYITNAVQSIETVKCFNGESYELQVFTKATSLAASLYKRVANLRSIQIGLTQFFTLTVFVQGFAYGYHLIRSGDLDVGSVITTFWAALLATGGITGFLPQFIVMQKGKISGARLRALIDQASKGDKQCELQGDFIPSRCWGDIEFRRVTFSYPTRVGEIALQDVTLSFPAGEATFVIGKSGSGKSTLGQLLVRFYQPSFGQILLDHVPLNKLDINWLRQNVTLVEQHSVLFDDNIYNNVAMGDRSGFVTTEDVKDAISFSMLEQVVQDLPAGLKTHLGTKGSSLSGGQKQRMALARARIRDTPVLILDESTSALDYVTRAVILQAIREWRRGKTTIVITHDVSQIQSDDFLYLLDNAQVLQEGYRRDLEAQPGIFHSFLTSHEENQDSLDREYSSDDGYDDPQTDDLMSLYRDSWIMPTPTRHPLSAVLFGQSVLSSFGGTPDRPDTVTSRTMNRLSRVTNEESNNDDQIGYFNVGQASSNLSSVAVLSAPSVIERNRLNTARTPRRLLTNRLFGRYFLNEKDYGSRPASQISSQPIPHHSTYPKRLPIAIVHTLQPSQPAKRSLRKKLRSEFSHETIANEPKVPTESLPIKHILQTVWPMIDWKSRLSLFAAFLATLVHAVATPMFSWVFSQLLVTFYAVEDTKDEATKYVLIILNIAVVDGFANYFMFYLYDSVAQSWIQALKTEAMKRILTQPCEFFDKEENSIARLAETLDHFAEEARNLPGRFAGIFLAMFLMMIVSVIWSLVISWKLTLVALASGPVLYAITKAYNMISSHWENLTNESADNVGQVLHETFVNIRTVRCMTLENHFHKKYEEATTNAVNVGTKRAIYSGFIFGLLSSSVLFVTIALFWFGAWLISRKEQSVLSITETFMILMMSINHVSQMSQYMTQVNISREAGTRLLRLARLPLISHESLGTIQIDSADDIAFSNVSFTYPTRSDHQVLNNVSFSIPRGSCTAIVGSSGSGKSTIAALLLKLYPTNHELNNLLASEGKDLTISGQNIKTLHTGSLRSRMAIVSQTPILFPGTIAHNTAYALSPSSSESSMKSIQAAADAAGVSEFINSLPNGYQTLVGVGGTVLSSGQAQRIAIARALIRNPDILILDEATSALDPLAANAIRDTVRQLVSTAEDQNEILNFPNSPPPLRLRSRTGGSWDNEKWEEGSSGWLHARGKGSKGKKKRKEMTVIIITHSKEMMSIAEHIVMLDKGRVVEEGGYTELKRKRDGPFARLLRGEAE